MATIQTALPWGSETRILGPRQKPGVLFNLINWWLRTTGRCWANWKWIKKYLEKSGYEVAIPTLKRWFARFAPQWGLKHVQIGARRWEFVRCEVIRHSEQTDTAKEVNPTELEATSTEVLSPLQASVGVDKKIRPDSKPPSPESGETAPEPPNSGLHSHPVESWKPGNLAQSHSAQSRGLRPRDGVVGAKTPVNNISPVENVSRPEKSTPANFDRYFGTFEEAGVALNEGDRIRACREWVSIEEPDRVAATTDAMVLCAARKACFIPLPVNHLRSKAWTRVAKPRTLELEDPNEPWICKMAREAKKKMGIRS